MNHAEPGNDRRVSGRRDDSLLPGSGAAYFGRLIERLANGGAEVAAISAVAPHICIRELERTSVLPLVNIIEETARDIRSRGFHTVALMGTRFVMETRMYGMLDGVSVFTPKEIDVIHAIYAEIVEGDFRRTNELEQIAQNLPVDAVVLAGTDFSGVLTETRLPYIDCLKVHTAGIMRQLRTPSSRPNPSGSAK